MTREEVIAVVNRALDVGISERTLCDLRGQFRGMHLSFCNDDDVINGSPYLRSLGLNVYLVDAREHCMTLTRDLDAATGLLLAEVTDEDE